MNAYFYLVSIIVLAAFFSYINQRFIKLPFVIGLFCLSVSLSLLVLAAKPFNPAPYEELQKLVQETKPGPFILNVFLGPLLFAGSLHTSWGGLRKNLKRISTLAFGGVLVCTAIIGGLFYFCSDALGLDVPLIYCFIFGALASPTDPIAVLGIMKKAGVPKKIESTIVGESLFNDGIGVVLFLALTEMVAPGNSGDFNMLQFLRLFLQEAVGGTIYGMLLGYLLHWLVRSTEHYETEMLLTIAFVLGGYYFASYLHISGPLAMVVMGLMMGNFRREVTMSDESEKYVSKFWELLDVILNAVLFILIALLLVVVELTLEAVLLGLFSIVIVLFSRVFVVYVTRFFFPRLLNFTGGESLIIVWGGLRGGLSLALVLLLEEGPYRNTLLIAAYCMVVFSIVVQGLTIGNLSKKILGGPGPGVVVPDPHY